MNSAADGARRVELSDFVIDTFGATTVLTGLVVANDCIVGRIPLFDLTFPPGFAVPLTADRGRFVTLSNVGGKLNPTAAMVLNGVFKVTAFAGGFTIGTAKVQTMTVREH